MNLSEWEIVNLDPPHDIYTWVKAIVDIKNNDTQEIRVHLTELLWGEDDKEPSTFIWEEGNFSCDCNRQLFFNRAGDEEDEDIPCGDEKFSVNIKNPKTNEYIYTEF